MSAVEQEMELRQAPGKEVDLVHRKEVDGAPESKVELLL